MAAKKKKTTKSKVRKVKAKSTKKTTKRSVTNTVRAMKAASGKVSAAAYSWQRAQYKTLKEFWPFYLNEHMHASNRLLHLIGSTAGLILFVVTIVTLKFWLLIPAFASGYAFAWVGHFFIEKNRPATFTYPIKSFISDWRMWYYVLTGKVYSEMRKFGIESK